MKVVINDCWGVFSLSDECKILYCELSGKAECCHLKIERNDEYLIQAIEMLGDKANGKFAKLKIVEVIDGMEFFIDDYDGIETIHKRN